MNIDHASLTIYYDASCSRCRHSIAWVNKNVSDSFEMVPLNEIEDSLLETWSLTRIEVEQQVWCTDNDGSLYGGVEAIAKILRQGPWWSELGGVVLGSSLGLFIGQGIYRRVAQRRR